MGTIIKIDANTLEITKEIKETITKTFLETEKARLEDKLKLINERLELFK